MRHATVEVHCGHRLAAAGIVLLHSGHSFVAGAGGAGGGAGMKRFTCLMIIKMTKATITNSKELAMKRATFLILSGVLAAGTAFAQSQSQPGTQAGATAGSSTSADASDARRWRRAAEEFLEQSVTSAGVCPPGQPRAAVPTRA